MLIAQRPLQQQHHIFADECLRQSVTFLYSVSNTCTHPLSQASVLQQHHLDSGRRLHEYPCAVPIVCDADLAAHASRDLSSNLITALPAGLFANMPKLATLYYYKRNSS